MKTEDKDKNNYPSRMAVFFLSFGLGTMVGGLTNILELEDQLKKALESATPISVYTPEGNQYMPQEIIVTDKSGREYFFNLDSHGIYKSDKRDKK